MATHVELYARYPLRPIRTDEEYERAVAVMNELVDRMSELNNEEDDYLNVLSDLVDRSPQGRKAEVQLESSTPINEYILRAMEDEGLTFAQIAQASSLPMWIVESVADGSCVPADEVVTAIRRAVDGLLLDLILDLI